MPEIPKRDPNRKFIFVRPYSGGSGRRELNLGLGDRIEKLVKPLAVALKMPCLDEEKKLKPESPCGKRRDKLNELGRKIGIGVSPPDPQNPS